MKYCLYTLLISALTLAQSTTSTYVTDLNGRRAEASSITASNGERTELSRSINGREVPLEQTEERILRQDANSKVTEKIVRKYDQTGRLTSTERVVTEEQGFADGGSIVKASTYVSDVNGQMHESERKTIESHKRGAVILADAIIQKPTINGTFETAEKRTSVTEPSDGGKHENETVYRRSQNGSFYEALRQTTDAQQKGDQTVENTAFYEPDVTGQLKLARQSVSTTSKRSDGTEVTEVNLFARAVDGRLQDNESPQQIKEQQIIERRKRADGAVVEALSVRRPAMSDPKRLGELKQVSETVCRGKCSADH